MVKVPPGTPATGAALGHLTRPGRALIGWLTPAEAQLMLAQHLKDQATLDIHVQRAASARAAVAERPAWGGAPDNVVSAAGAELQDHLARLGEHPDFRPFAQEGWRVVVADLRRVCALQPMVFWDPAEDRVQDVQPGDLPALARLMLPLPDAAEPIPLQFDPALNTWIVSSRNPNLRILGHFNTPIEAGNGQTYLGCGFFVAATPSFAQVVRYRGRYLLRDGYHRALGLLSRGVTHAPVLFREVADFESLGRSPGMLPEQAYLGERPAMLPDYLSDTVAAAVRAPASQKMIVIQGLEMSPFG